MECNKKMKLKANEACSMITDNGDNEIEVDSIDRLIDKEVTFIKMDLEGSEYEALLGAEKMIKRTKPKLAICVYHKPEYNVRSREAWKNVYINTLMRSKRSQLYFIGD